MYCSLEDSHFGKKRDFSYDVIILFSERKGYRLLKWVGKSLKTLFVRSNQETVRIIVTNIDHLWSEVSWILGYRARGVRI